MKLRVKKSAIIYLITRPVHCLMTSAIPSARLDSLEVSSQESSVMLRDSRLPSLRTIYCLTSSLGDNCLAMYRVFCRSLMANKSGICHQTIIAQMALKISLLPHKLQQTYNEFPDIFGNLPTSVNMSF